MNSSEIERTLHAVWTHTASARHRRRIQEELADHLHEAAAEERARGLVDEEAERRAAERFGHPHQIAHAFPTSPWRLAAALLALGAMAALIWAEVTTHQASIRTCLGGRCPIWLPRAPQHPIRERVELVTAIAAGLLAISLMTNAAWRQWRSARAYNAAVERRPAGSHHLTTRTLLADSLQWPARLATLGLALTTLTGAALTAQWQTTGPPPLDAKVVPLRSAVLHPHAAPISAPKRAHALLKQILRQLPGRFTSVRLSRGEGLWIDIPAWARYRPRETGPTPAIARFETIVLAMAFADRQATAGLHVGGFETPDISGRLSKRPPTPTISAKSLRREVTAHLHHLGMSLATLTITHPDGPFVIATVRATDPRRYVERPPQARSRHTGWCLLIMQDDTGTVRAVFTAGPGWASSTDTRWYDPRLFPAQPDTTRHGHRPDSPTPHAPTPRAPRG